jgi:hypothetical protein
MVKKLFSNGWKRYARGSGPGKLESRPHVDTRAVLVCEIMNAKNLLYKFNTADVVE